MKSRPYEIAVNDATSRYDRWLRALDPDYARPDARPLSDLLSFAVEYGSLVNFYNLEDEIDGDWVRFFLSDPTMILACIDASNPAQSEAELIRLKQQTLDAASFDAKFQSLRAAFEVPFALARLADGWLRGLDVQAGGDTVRLLRDEITAAIEDGLGEAMRRLKSYDEGAGLPDALGRRIGLDYSAFLSVWSLNRAYPDGSIYRGRRSTKKIDRAVPHLMSVFQPIADAVWDLKSFARSNLSATLDTGDHKPNNALYIAFCELFETAQNTINTFSSRYVNFYYRDVLRETNSGPVPDSVYLAFTLAESEEVRRETVPRGTLFPAGQDLDGRDLLYAWDQDLAVTATRVASLRTLRVVGGPLIVETAEVRGRRSEARRQGSEVGGQRPEVGGQRPEVECQRSEVIGVDDRPMALTPRQVFSSEINTDAEEGKTGAAWPTFGHTHVGKSDIEVTENATLGFAIASNYLLLTGGERTVGVCVRYGKEFKEKILDPMLEEIAQATGLDPDYILRAVLEGAFALYVSTAAGWAPVDGYAVTLSEPSEANNSDQARMMRAHPGERPGEHSGDPGFELWFKLPPTFPPLVSYDPQLEADESESAPVSKEQEVNASNPSPSLPTFKAYLRHSVVCLTGPDGTASIYPLTLFAEMTTTGFIIRTEVTGLADLQIENTDGEVDTSAPFLVFGGLPVVGSYLQIRHSELFVKTLDWFQMRMSWFNLPQNDDGFKGYYKYYVIGPNGHPQPNLFDNRVFRGKITVQNPGSWSVRNVPTGSPPVDPADVYLFRTRDDCLNPIPTPDGRLCSDTDFDTLKVIPAEPPKYYNPADTSIRLQLSEPSYGFGYDLYAQNVLNAVIEDLPDPDKCNDKCLAECQPLADAVQCVQDCVTACQETQSGDEYKACVEACLTGCGEALATAAVDCLISCLLKCLGEGLAKLIEPRLKAGISAPATERSLRIKRAINESRALAGPDASACLEGCLRKKCLRLVEASAVIEEAILCVAACAIDSGASGDVNRACVESCLDTCVTQLQTIYDEWMKVCLDECMSLKKELKYPNEPYLPQSTSLTVNYAAHCTFQTTRAENACGLFYHLLPFGGYCRITTEAHEEPTLVPYVSSPGNLYIGFSGLAPPQTLTLLFRMAADRNDGSAALPQVEWDYLTGNEWVRLQTAQIRSDLTNGLQNSGVITLSLPSYDPVNNTVLSGEFQWLRASVARDPGLFPDTAGIYPNSGLATWRNIDNTGEHLRKPLPAYTINSSVQDLPDIESIEQPMESFGGRAPETEREFEVRVGERLQHKDRGILGWDYERLVLERFPTIWKVRALPARSSAGGDEPGEVLVVVVPGPDSIQVVDPTTPMATSQMLGQIRAYLEGLISPFIRLQVVNPVYVRITVTTTVEFNSGEDEGDCIERLNEELIDYLSPWFYDAARAAKEGQYATESDISEFIQTRPYVKAMLSIRLSYQPDPKTLEWFFLTSALEHKIRVARLDLEERSWSV